MPRKGIYNNSVKLLLALSILFRWNYLIIHIQDTKSLFKLLRLIEIIEMLAPLREVL